MKLLTGDFTVQMRGVKPDKNISTKHNQAIKRDESTDNYELFSPSLPTPVRSGGSVSGLGMTMRENITSNY